MPDNYLHVTSCGEVYVEGDGLVGPGPQVGDVRVGDVGGGGVGREGLPHGPPVGVGVERVVGRHVRDLHDRVLAAQMLRRPRHHVAELIGELQ